MADSMWHLEHADGRRWTKRELTAIVRGDLGSGEEPRDYEWWDSYIDQRGHVILMDTWGGWHGVADEEDMVVVWDD